ncbi:MAG: tRNA (guanosine(37)-N1)-methyltransferase TrmD [Pseudomonadota bacterium]
MTEPRKPRSAGMFQPQVSAQPRPLMKDRIAPGSYKAKILTLFPGAFPGTLGEGLIGKALKDGLWSCEAIDIRRFATDKHRTVDDAPAGGGAGLIMKPDVLGKALDFALRSGVGDRTRTPVIYLSPRGRPLTQSKAEQLAKADGAVLLCGRYEGVDQRVLDAYEVEEISIGDYVLTGGEVAAQVLLDAVIRLRPGVLGNAASTEDESFSRGLLEHPQFTKPSLWQGRAVPEVLLSGHHARIAEWRRDQSERLTRERRPDLWRAYGQSPITDPEEVAEQSDAQTIAGKGGHEKD